jgi:ligand-binding sensor domain-containing protein
MALFIYGTATNTGKGFFTHQDRQNFYLSGQPANVWVVGNNEKGALWLASKNGVEKTKTEAQALVTAEVTAAQEAWDALSDEAKARNDRPSQITLP